MSRDLTPIHEIRFTIAGEEVTHRLRALSLAEHAVLVRAQVRLRELFAVAREPVSDVSREISGQAVDGLREVQAEIEQVWRQCCAGVAGYTLEGGPLPSDDDKWKPLIPLTDQVTALLKLLEQTAARLPSKKNCVGS
jgi:hypothetical protein